METKESLLIPNTRVSIRRWRKDGYEVYQSRIEDVTAEFIALSMPMKEGSVVPLQVGDVLEVTITKDNGLYVFTGPITRRERERLPLMYLAIPEKIERQQRRQYVRVETFIPVSFRKITRQERLTVYEKCAMNPQFSKNQMPSLTSLAEALENKEPAAHQGIIHNISGGGMLVVSSQKITKDELLFFRFALHTGEKNIEVYAQVIRAYEFSKEDTSYPFSLGMQYLVIEANMRHKVVQYAFKRQIQLKNKGLL